MNDKDAFFVRILVCKRLLDLALADAGVRRRLSLYGWVRAAELDLETALDAAVAASSYGGSFSERVSLEVARIDLEAKKGGRAARG